MDDISGGNSQKIKKKTIAQAILEVMGETNRPMTSQEICQLILDRNLYQPKSIHLLTNIFIKMEINGL